MFQNMSGFFSLGGGYTIHKDEPQQHHHNQNHEDDDTNSIITPNSLYLFKNEEIYNSKGFEIWQQYYQQHRQQQQQQAQTTQHDLCLNNNEDTWKMMRQGGYGMGMGMGMSGGNSSNSGNGINCQDCGNQAKKDCQHMRCRTCCKSRGFQCQTHVKSTWVPAAKRRERQQQLSSLPSQQQQPHSQQQQQQQQQQLSLMMSRGGVDQNPKRLREDQQLMTTVVGGGSSSSGVLNLHHHNTSSGLEIGHFPAEVTSPAVFRCVRVSSMDEAEEQLAYQTAVNIGGHLFKGILYDRGPEDRYNHPSGSGGTQHQQLNLITSGSMGVTVASTSVQPNVTTIDPSSIYPTPLNAFMAGTQFFPPPRS